MKWLTATLCLAAIVLCTGDAMAARCSDIATARLMFCDDFDRWCEEPPVDPDAACPLGSPEDNDAFRADWPQSDGICSSDVPYSLSTVDMWKPDGYAVYAPQNQSSEKLARHVHDMTPEILDKPLNTEGYGAINGSGEILSSTDPNYVDPSTDGTCVDSLCVGGSNDGNACDTDDDCPGGTILKGQFFVHVGNQHCAYGNFIYYTELYLGDDRAPTNFVRINCYPEAQGPYQKLQTTDGVVHASFAFGLMAAFDDVTGNPCDVDMGRKPTAWRAFVYDGLTWTRLKGPAFGLPVPDSADFRPWSGEHNRFEFYVGSDNIEIRLYNTRAEMLNGDGTCVGSRCVGGPSDGSNCETDDDCAPSSTGSCVSGTCTDLGSCTDIGYCDLGGSRCVGGYNDKKDCTTDADCPNSCEGGANDQEECSTAADCPDGCRRGMYDGDACSTDADCGGLACWGGSRADLPCSIDEDCPGGLPLVPQPYFVALVPRQYTGPFNKIAMGAGKGVDLTVPTCELVGPVPIMNECVGGINSATSNLNGVKHPCTTAADCPPSQGSCVSSVCVGGANHGGACTQTCPDGVCNVQGQCVGGANDGLPCDCPDYEECLEPLSWEENGYKMKVEEVVLYDGVFVPSDTQGACCKPDTACEETDQETCEDPEGLNGLWMGGQTTCAETMCCYTPWADADGDGDVDQVDFGIFQACFSGPGNAYEAGCECFDRDATPDGDVDGNDFIEFSECWSGPKVLWGWSEECPGTW